MKIEKITPQIAALYLGQNCDINPEAGFEVIKESFEPEIGTALISHLKAGHLAITPHLRRIESITEEECKDAFKLVHGREWALNVDEYTCKARWWKTVSINKVINCSDEILGRPNTWLYLLSRGFDIFGLIDAGLAKEITTKTNEP